jgi:hypothetical protein
MESRKTIFGTPSLPPPFPPFPPQSSVFQGDVFGKFFPIFTRAMFPFVAKEAKN